MAYATHAIATHTGLLAHRTRRLVEVRVLVGSHEVDAFQASAPETLRPALRPIYAHLAKRDAAVRFTGVEEDWLPLRIRRSRREQQLAGPRAALAFLSTATPSAVPAAQADEREKVTRR